MKTISRSHLSVILILIWILLGVVARLLPHPPNMTPLLALSFLAGHQLSQRDGCLIVLATLIISDVILGIVEKHAFFGVWTLLTYSGFLLAMFIGSKIAVNKKTWLFFCVMPVSFGFWLWTNFGVWLISGMYPLTLMGLEACFVLAIPFLKNSLIGDLFWSAVFLSLLYFIKQERNYESSNYRVL